MTTDVTTTAAPPLGEEERRRRDELLERALFLDIETLESGALREIGAVLGSDEFRRKERGALRNPAAALAELDLFAAGARVVVGHNLLAHDLPRIAAESAALRLLGLPVIDTLILSPLAFPRRPYHELVKDYKLVGDARSDPVGDARLARRLLEDEWAAFATLRATDPAALDVLRSCLDGWRPREGAPDAAARGCAQFLGALGGRQLADDELVEIALGLLGARVCATAARPAISRTLADAQARPAVAYALQWVLVADTRSVLPRWVASAFPATAELVRLWRDVPCGSAACAWCAETHDPRRALRRWFRFDAFRGPPCGERGVPMQEEVVRLGMAGEPTLAILPTSFGKSLCYQLPAIARYVRRGTLTVVVSPLQALMKDQVDVLEGRVHGDYAAALHGMLTPPERGEVLARVRDGSLAMVYAAPEQLRNRSFGAALRAREIGAWVFDEAHCVSRWGHDFRTDYRYAADFIRRLSEEQRSPPAPVFCFTATAKRDVREDVIRHFREQLGAELLVVESPIERGNLAFCVRETAEPAKFAAVEEEIRATLAETDGRAIVYLATRRRTEEAAQFLHGRGELGRVEAFHAGIEPPRKREIQDAFKQGDVRVICATNAFGMGVDQPNVRLVVHADAPGSLENYLQEAGRAGRDDLPARCVLLWCPSDLDVQFGLLARSRLTQRDIGQVLRALRRARRGGAEQVVATPHELLHDENTDVSFDAADRDARTKVYTAVAWLERAEFLARDENHTRVFQGRPQVRDIADAEARIARLDLSATQRARWLSILRALLSADDRQGLDLDELAAATGLAAWRDDAGSPASARPAGRRSPALQLLNTLRDMARQGLIDEGLCLSAFVRLGMADSSVDRLSALDALESALLDLLREAAPDLEPEGDEVPLDLRPLNDALVRRGHRCAPELLRRIVRSLAEDGRGLAGERGSLVLTHRGGDRYGVRLRRSWDALTTTSARRRRVAARVLEALEAKAQHDELGRGELLVTFAMDDLMRRMEALPDLLDPLREPVAALERALLYLHEQRVVVLQRGLAVFRQAMGVRFPPDARQGAYTAGDYADLRFHYDERIHQVHAMGEYARLGVTAPQRVPAYVADYFGTTWGEFAERWFPGQEEEIARATSRESYARIVEELRSPAQQRIVAGTTRRNALVLAGPGSGKTRVIVHRCAYLLLVERVPPTSILVLCFNRAACHELRRRLRALAGGASHGVQVHTFHGLALRVTGRSLAQRALDDPGADAPLDFEALLRDAVALLRGDVSVSGMEPDELRDRLLSGYQHVLVDEYQDVDAAQYELISAVAGRRGSAGERAEPASLLAVGDDDQNIYGWRGATCEFLRRFRDDYDATSMDLLENYRSTAHIVAVAQALMENGPERMKAGRRLRVDRARRATPAARSRVRVDRVSGGRVQVLRVRDRGAQAAAVLDEIDRLRLDAGDLGFGDFAVLARTHTEIDALRAACEARRVPCRRRIDGRSMPPLRHVREIALALERLGDLGNAAVTPEDLRACVLQDARAPGDGVWDALLCRAVDEWDAALGGEPAPAREFVEHLHELLVDARTSHAVGEGVFLGTVHGAKGLEFPHVFVLDGGWETPFATGEGVRPHAERLAEQRRTYYVALTRAARGLHVVARADAGNPFVAEILAAGGTHVRERDLMTTRGEAADAARAYDTLTLADIDLGYAGRRTDEALHGALRALRTGQCVSLCDDGDRTVVVDALGRTVGALSARAHEAWRARLRDVAEVRVLAMLRRDRSCSADAFRDSVRAEQWEVPLLEIVTEQRLARG